MKPIRHAVDSVASQSTLQHAFVLLEHALTKRLRQSLQPDATPDDDSLPDLPVPAVVDPFGRFVRELELDSDAQLLLVLAFAPCLQPDLFDRIVQKVLPGAGDYPQFGGIRGKQHRGFLPTGDTALFLLAGDDLVARMRWQTLLCGDHPLVRKGIVYLEEPENGDPPMSGRLMLDSDYAERFIRGKSRAPRLSLKFPAQRLETGMEWDDLVLPSRTVAEIRELENWVRHGHVLFDDWNMRRKLRPGCRALFHGPPGTGKTVTASVLGKTTDRHVYRVDLSMVVSKYIGETEKNLSQLLARAEQAEVILLFDEADSLFGKRTDINDSNDRFANAQTNYLLQRIESYAGIVLLTSNSQARFDTAFARRLDFAVEFPAPGPEERRKLWLSHLGSHAEIEPAQLNQLAALVDLSGAQIRNAVLAAAVLCQEERRRINHADLMVGLESELRKHGKQLAVALRPQP